MKRALIAVIAALGLAGGGVASVAALTANTTASCTPDPAVSHDDASRTSSLTLTCSVPYPDQATATETVTEPAPPPATVTETAPAPPPVTVTVTATPSPAEQPTPTVTPTPTEQPPAPAAKTQFGASVINGGSLSSTITKWGAKVHIRQFIADTSSNPPTWAAVPAGTVVHRSYKPPTTITDAQIDALLNAARVPAGQPRNEVSFWHESDNDGLTGTALTARKALMNRLYDRNVALGRPVIVAFVVTGQFFSDYRDEAYKAPWRDVKADVIAPDFDGGGPSNATSFTDEIGETLTWLTEENTGGEYSLGWAVPEFGRGRDSGESGAGRTAWMQREVGKMMNASPKPLWVDWFDYQVPGSSEVYPLDSGTPEYDYWKSLVSQN